MARFGSSSFHARRSGFISTFSRLTGEAKIWIEPEIELARNYQLSDQDLSRVLQLVIEHEQEIRDAWHRHFDS